MLLDEPSMPRLMWVLVWAALGYPSHLVSAATYQGLIGSLALQYWLPFGKPTRENWQTLMKSSMRALFFPSLQLRFVKNRQSRRLYVLLLLWPCTVCNHQWWQCICCHKSCCILHDLNRKVQCCFSADNLVSCLLIMSCDAGIACSSIQTYAKLTNGVSDVKPAWSLHEVTMAQQLAPSSWFCY